MSSSERIILFKTTYRPEYKRLLLSALSAPIGTYFWTYYKKEHVSNYLIEEIKKSSSFNGKKVTLIFFNLNEKAELRFYPLRDFTIRKIDSDGAINFYLCPGEYYEYDQKGLEYFNRVIHNEMIVLPPSEHSYAQLCSLTCLDKLNKNQSQEAWMRLVEYLDRKEMGKEDDFKESIFFMLGKLTEKGSNATEIAYTKERGYDLKSGKLYEWNGLFYKPRLTKESFQVKFEGTEGIIPITDQINIMPGRNLPFKLEFRCTQVYNDKDIKIRISIPNKDLNGDAPRNEIPAKINKISYFDRIGIAGVIVFLGLIVTPLAQTYIPNSEIKFILGVLGSIFTTFGIMMWQSRSKGE